MAIRDPSKFVGAGIEVEIGSKKYIAMPLTFRDYFSLANHVRSRQLDVFLSSSQAKLLPTEERQKLIERITNAEVDLQTQANTVEGAAYLCWRSLNKKQPDLTLDDVTEMVMQNRDLVSIIQAASGITPEEGGDDTENPPPTVGLTGSA